MRKILAQCPRCKSRFKVIADKVAGKKLRCIACKQAFRVPASAAQFVAKSGSSRSKPDDDIEDYDGIVELIEEDNDDIGGVEIVDDFDEFSVDEFDEYEEPIQRRKPVSALPLQAGRRKPDQSRGVDDEENEDDSSAGNTKLLVAAISVCGVLVVGGVIYGAAKILPNIQLGRKLEAPAQFDLYDEPDVQMLCEYPSGWDLKEGGGFSGIPTWVRFEHGNATINIRESVRGAAMGDIAGQQRGVEKEVPAELEPVALVHEEQKGRIAEDYSDWEEDPPLKIVTKFGSSLRRAEFHAVGKGPFGKKYRGYRATLLNNITSYNVVCVCPEGEFDTLKAAFERVINSIQSK